MGKLRNFLLLLLLCICTSPAYADTTVSGAITADTTWTLAGSPYIVSSTVTVYGSSTTPATLTIEPGVTVKFASNVSLLIGNGSSQGALVARGTASERITFTRNGESGNWGNIRFQDSTVDASTIIENADISHGNTIYFQSASPALKNTTITDVKGHGLYVSYSNPTLENVTISSNGTYGIYLSSSNPTITGCTVTNTNAAGYGIYGTGSPVISSSTINITNAPGKYGLYLTTTTSALSVTSSTIGNGLYLGTTGITPTITGNTFTNSDNSPPMRELTSSLAL